MRLPVAAPLRLHAATVEPGWVDYNHHLSEWAYLLIVGDNADAFFRFIGVDDDYRTAGQSLYTAETHLRHLREVKLGQQVTLTLQVLGCDDKRLHLVHEMFKGEGDLVATAEQMLLHVGGKPARVEPFGTELADRLHQVAGAHSALAVPGYVGRSIRALRS